MSIIPNRFSLGEDFIFNIEYLKHINTVKFISSDLYVYNATSGGLTTKYNRSTLLAMNKRFSLIWDLLENNEEQEWKISICRSITNESMYFIRLLGESKNISGIMQEVKEISVSMNELMEIDSLVKKTLIIRMICEGKDIISSIFIKIYSIPYIFYNTIKNIFRD